MSWRIKFSERIKTMPAFGAVYISRRAEPARLGST